MNLFDRACADNPKIFRNDGEVLFCLMCDDKVNAKQMSQVTQHLQTTKHLGNVQRKSKATGNKVQTLLTAIPSQVETQSASNFAMDLTNAFLKSNIALHKIRHPAIKEFIEKHTKFGAPTEYTLRDKCLPKLFDETIEQMKKIAAGKYIWVSIDETTDTEQRAVANFVFGVLGEPDRCYLFNSKVLEATNNYTVSAFLDECVNELSEFQRIRF